MNTLYRCYSGEGDLVYVGRTRNIRRRIADHRRGAAWWTDVARITMASGFPDDASAARAEALAIAWEAPRENIVGAIGLEPPTTSDASNRSPRYFRATDDEFDRLAEIAHAEQRTASGEIRWLIQRRIAEVDRREKRRAA